MKSFFQALGYVDLDGNSVERVPQEYPYSYSPYVTYKNGEKEDITNTVFSDRLLQWDFKKYDTLIQKHFGNEGQYFDNRSPKKIEAFLSDYFDKPNIKLIAIMKGANMANGYPYWIFHFAV